MINYVIATYSGIYRENENKEFVLQKQLHQLRNLLLKSETSAIGKVTVMCPAPRHPAYAMYYQKNKWLSVFAADFPHIQITFQDYVGDNRDHSYDQYLQAYLASPEFEYYLFMEDDYCFDTVDPRFDEVLINLYRKRFPEGVGYMAMLANCTNGHTHHAAISNGLVSGPSLARLGDPLQMYYDMASVEKYPQLRFSLLFTENGMYIKDFSDVYDAWFWNSETGELKNLSVKPSGHSFIVPVQALLKQSGSA
jgi:hypothetical protein